MARRTNNADDLPHDKETWERRISHRREVLEEARKSGDKKYAQLAEERLNRALDGYSRDCR